MRFSWLFGVVAMAGLVAAACGGGTGDDSWQGEASPWVRQGGGPGNVVLPAFEPDDADAPEIAPDPAPAPLGPAPWAAAPTPYSTAQSTVPVIDARAAIVVDEASGAVLYEHNAYQPLPPASLTKIITTLVALEYGDLDQVVEVDIDAREMHGSSRMGIIPGDRFTLRDLLFGLMLPSGNDAALAIGRAISGTDAAFVDLMNQYAERLQLSSARFANPHGLDARGHRISAYDLAMVSRYAMSQERFVEFATTRYWVAEGSRTVPMGNLNGFLGNYPGADGIKVGFTYRAGKTLVASATRDGHRVYAVLMNAPASQADAIKLMDWAFAQHQWPE